MSEKSLSEQIRAINESKHFSEDEKDRLIAELLRHDMARSGKPEFNPLKGYFISFFLPPLGFFVGIHYLLRYDEEGIKPGIICIALTFISLVIQFFLFKNILIK